MIRNTILGISPGSKVCGIAVYRENILVHLKVCTKNTSALTEIQSVITEHQIQTVAILEIHPSRGSPATRAALERIVSKLEEQNLPLSMYSIEWLKKHTTVRNKRELFRRLADMFPELSAPYHKSQRERNPYWSKLMEAVACAHTVTLD